jgi:hypothetical protein
MFTRQCRLFLLDRAWRHAALGEAVSEVHMQSIDECMEEVALQMQMQMPKRQEDKDTFEHDPNGVQKKQKSI